MSKVVSSGLTNGTRGLGGMGMITVMVANPLQLHFLLFVCLLLFACIERNRREWRAERVEKGVRQNLRAFAKAGKSYRG
jgi:hypothetical protein